MPDWKTEIRARLDRLNLGAEREMEVVEELSQHLDDRFEELLSRGIAENEATRRALDELDTDPHLTRELRGPERSPRPSSSTVTGLGSNLWGDLQQDLRYAARMLWKNPGFAIVAVLTLALGIGANTAIFSIVNGVLLRPLAYREPDRIVTLLHGTGGGPVSGADFIDWRAQSHSFERMAAAEAWGGTLTGGDRPEALQGIRMGEGMMDLLGVPAALGRTFQVDDYIPGHEHVVILSYRLWQRRFGGRHDIIGQPITLSDESYTVIAVMPPDFQFAPFWATKSEICAPLVLGDRANNRGAHSLRIFGRLKEGVSLQESQADMDAICKRLEQAYPDSNTGRTIQVNVLMDKVVGNIRQALVVLLVAVVFVLLIACANVANLLLVRAAGRQKEMAVRAALGAGRWRTIRQLLTESLVLATLAGILGLGIGCWGLTALKAYLEGTAGNFNLRIPRIHDVNLDTPTLFFTLTVTLLTGAVFGLAPALQSSKVDLHETLKESSRGSSGSRRSGKLRASLVIAEIALALIMLSGAGLLMRSFVRLAAVDPGFNPQNLLSMTVSLAGQTGYTGPNRIAFYEELFRRIEAQPGVVSASAINHLPLAGDQWGRGLSVEGRPPPPPGQGIGGVYRVCRPKYFATMGIPLVRGRDFSDQDQATTPDVVIINETFARRHFAGQNPIGQRLTMDDLQRTPKPEWMTIVGVVKDAKQDSWTDDASNEFYLPWLQTSDYVGQTAGHFAYMTLVIRTTINPRSVLSGVQSAVWSLNKNAPISNVTTMEDVTANAVWQQRFNLVLIAIFAALALVLAGVGIYGVMAYTAAQRTQEIGIRMALGAQRRDVMGLILRQGIALAAIGIGIGLAGALGLGRMLQTLLYSVSPSDPLTLASVSGILGVVAFLACWFPARRAMQVDPMVALRNE